MRANSIRLLLPLAAMLASVAGAQAKADKDLSAEEWREKYFTEGLAQKPGEIKAVGPASRAAPPEGHYACKTTMIRDDAQTKNGIGSDGDYSGFDLFADGAYRLKKDGAFEKSGYDWRHNPENGVIVFEDGPLSRTLQPALHVVKQAGGREVSILYRMFYNYEEKPFEFILCVNAGTVGTKSPKAETASVADKNLAPPPPGGKRISGLFYDLKWTPMIGPNFTMYQEPHYYYRYFQDNGYVWVGGPPADGDFDALGCNKPIVDKTGAPKCTTYEISGGLFSKPTIRIGHDAPKPFEQNDGMIKIDGTRYLAIDAAKGLRLDKSFSYFSYNGVVSQAGDFTPTKDGRYHLDASSGVLYSTPDVGGPRTHVAINNGGDETRGAYKIDGYSITLTNEAGNVAKKFFAMLGDDMIMLGGRAYIHRK